MDLKYLTPTQTFDVVYEGVTRRFTLISVITHDDTEDESMDLTHSLNQLSLECTRLWSVSWDTFVTLLDDSSSGENSDDKVNDRSNIPISC